MESTVAMGGTNSGFQIGQSIGPVTANFYPSNRQDERAADEACLRDLRITDPTHDKTRIEAEKGGLLVDAYKWVLENPDFKTWLSDEQSQLLWVKGDPGKGKTMLLCGIINELAKSASDDTAFPIVSFFFCQASDEKFNHGTAVLRGLIFMLVKQQPSFISHVRQQYDKAGKQIFEDINAWEALSDMLRGILQDMGPKQAYMIVDGLDECATGLDRLLDLIAQESDLYPHVKWIVSSRNWPVIEEAFDEATRRTKLWLELNEKFVADAVAVFIRYKVQKLTERKRYNEETSGRVLQHLLENSHGTFLWVSLVCKRLEQIPKGIIPRKLDDFPPGLDKLYWRMLNQIEKLGDSFSNLCKSLLGVIVTVLRPITLDELPSCMNIPGKISSESELEAILDLCGSFITVNNRVISLLHQSAKDFLLGAAIQDILPKGQKAMHRSIFSQSMQCMSKVLQQDIYNLVHPGTAIGTFEKPDEDPLSKIQYSCIYWIEHLGRSYPNGHSAEDFRDSGLVGRFFRNDYLHWLEALSLLEKVPDGVASIFRLQSFLKEFAGDHELVYRVYDACCFARYHNSTIENYPLQIYASGLVFSPAQSATRIQFKEESPKWLSSSPLIEDHWSPCLQTIFQFGCSSLAFSNHSNILAIVPSVSKTIVLWDVDSVRFLQELEIKNFDWNKGDYEYEKNQGVHALIFSFDSKLIALSLSTEVGHFIEIWDIRSGHCLQSLQGHGSPILSIVFSHDSKTLTSASKNGEIHSWNVDSGECRQASKIISCEVLTLSRDSKLIASASPEGSMLWNAENGQFVGRLGNYLHSIKSLSFSRDSKLIALVDNYNGFCILNIADMQNQRTIKVGYDLLAFSHDLQLFALKQGDDIMIWDTNNNHRQTLRGEAIRIEYLSVSFSHDSKLLASGFYDCKLWDISSQHLQAPGSYPDSHPNAVTSVVFSHDSKYVASFSEESEMRTNGSGLPCSSVKVWDADNGQCVQTIEEQEEPIVFSHTAKLLASVFSNARTISITDLRTSNIIRAQGHKGRVISIAFSHNDQVLASSSHDCTTKLWNTVNGHCLQTLDQCSLSLSFSYDSQFLATVSKESNTIYKAENSKYRMAWSVLVGMEYSRYPRAAFSFNSKLVAFARKNTIEIWDLDKRSCVHTFVLSSGFPYCIALSQDSKLLATILYPENPFRNEVLTVKLFDVGTEHELYSSEIEFDMFKLPEDLSTMSFDSTNSFLETHFGIFCLAPGLGIATGNNDNELSQHKGYTVDKNGDGFKQWVSRDRENILLIPEVYRVSTFAVKGPRICIGCTNGRVLCFMVDSDEILKYLELRGS